MVKKILTKKIRNIVYEIVYFEGDNKYVAYKIDIEKLKDNQIHCIPEEAVFESKEEAVKYFKTLK